MSSEHLNSDLPTESENSAVSSTAQTAESMTMHRSLPGFQKPRRPLWPVLTVTMLMVASFVGWRIYNRLTAVPGSELTETTIAQARLPVRVIPASTSSIQGWVFDEGTVWPVQRRILNFQAGGDITYVTKIDGIDLREGDWVSQGQLLATIDDRRQMSSIETAEADIQVSINQRDQSEASLLQAQANLAKAESDLTLAQTELHRYQTLFEQGAISESDRDLYRNQVDQAEAALKTAQQDIHSAEDSVRSAEATIASSRARLNEVDVDLEDTQLVSPIDGIVAYINIREGEYWDTQYLDRSSAQSAIETAPIVVMDPQTFEVELEVQANGAEQIRPGQRAYVVLEEVVSATQAAGATRQDLLEIAQQQGSAGSVFSVSPSQTPGGRGTEVTIRDFQQVRNLKVGGRAYVWMEVASQRDTVVLPLGALVSRDQAFYAFVVNETDGTVQRRRVTQGIQGLSGVEILAGVEPGELVVVEGQNRLVEGTPVEIAHREQGQ